MNKDLVGNYLTMISESSSLTYEPLSALVCIVFLVTSLSTNSLTTEVEKIVRYADNDEQIKHQTIDKSHSIH